MAAEPQQLVAAAVRARTDALYRQHRRQVLRICRSLLRDRADAEDAAQQVFLSAHRALLNGAAPREPLAWLAAIARRECWARSARVSRTAQVRPTVGDDTASIALRKAEVTALWLAIAELPAAQREVLLLREIRGLSYLQLGQALALSPPATRSLLARARRRVRLRLQDLHTAAGSVPLVETFARLIATGINPAAPAARVAALGVVAGGAFVAPDMLEHHVRRPLPTAAAVGPHHARARRLTPAAPARRASPESHVAAVTHVEPVVRVVARESHRPAERPHRETRSRDGGARPAARASDGGGEGGTAPTIAQSAPVVTVSASSGSASTDGRDGRDSGGGGGLGSSDSGHDGGGTDGGGDGGSGSD